MSIGIVKVNSILCTYAIRDGFPRAISIGIRLLDSIVDELYRHEEPSAIYSYRSLYNSVNTGLDRVSLIIVKKAQEAGFRAYPITASQTVNERRLEEAISHKLAVNLSGARARVVN